MTGKVSPADLAEFVFSRTGADDAAVRQGPAYGEDAAAIRVGDETLVASSDPISLAAERIGTLGVHVAANDVAASGATPRWLTSVVFLPEEDPELLDVVTAQMDRAARDLDVSIVGGHSEYLPPLSRPVVSLTAMGLADEYVPTAGATPGDLVVLTRGAGVEGTAILATDFRDELADVPAETLDAATGFFAEISVVTEALAVAPHATAMHDPTEGGVLTGLFELAAASGVALDLDRDAVPVRPETERLCAAMDVDPLAIFGSGALVVTVAPDDRERALSALRETGVEASVVGEVVESGSPELRFDGETYREAVRDDLYDLWE